MKNRWWFIQTALKKRGVCGRSNFSDCTLSHTLPLCAPPHTVELVALLLEITRIRSLDTRDTFAIFTLPRFVYKKFYDFSSKVPVSVPFQKQGFHFLLGSFSCGLPEEQTNHAVIFRTTSHLYLPETCRRMTLLPPIDLFIFSKDSSLSGRNADLRIFFCFFFLFWAPNYVPSNTPWEVGLIRVGWVAAGKSY